MYTTQRPSSCLLVTNLKVHKLSTGLIFFENNKCGVPFPFDSSGFDEFDGGLSQNESKSSIYVVISIYEITTSL